MRWRRNKKICLVSNKKYSIGEWMASFYIFDIIWIGIHWFRKLNCFFTGCTGCSGTVRYHQYELKREIFGINNHTGDHQGRFSSRNPSSSWAHNRSAPLGHIVPLYFWCSINWKNRIHSAWTLFWSTCKSERFPFVSWLTLRPVVPVLSVVSSDLLYDQILVSNPDSTICKKS